MNNQAPYNLMPGYPVTPNFPNQFPNYPNMPNPNCNCKEQLNNIENRLNRMERAIRRLENRVNRLENGYPVPLMATNETVGTEDYNNYQSTSMYMM